MASNDQLLLQFIKTEAVDSNESTDSFINLKVQDYSKNATVYKVKKTKPLNKLKQVHCDRNGLNIEIMRFLFDGKRIKDNDTPDSLEMENNDIIDIVCRQDGVYKRKILINTGKTIKTGGKVYKIYDLGKEEIKCYYKIYHIRHKDEGISYDNDCPICHKIYHSRHKDEGISYDNDCPICHKIYHSRHKDEGISYDNDCPICQGS
ncbi:unnamed protein product [Rhizophagus irregularis]|nr:unnamed protein product [Rhizophagus irregularis]CAB5350797.1 unnamed protein product [Rhizophagus irregularis]